MRSHFACARFGTLLTCVLLLTAQSASAGNDCTHTHRVSCLPQILFHSESKAVPAKPAQPVPESTVLLSLDPHSVTPGHVRSELRFSLKKGVEYRRHFAVGPRRLTLELWGPIVKKKPGFGVELKGLELGDHDVRVDAYGNTGQGKIRVKLSF